MILCIYDVKRNQKYLSIDAVKNLILLIRSSPNNVNIGPRLWFNIIHHLILFNFNFKSKNVIKKFLRRSQ